MGCLQSDADHRSKLRTEERGSGVDIATKENRGGPLLAQDMEEEESGPRNDLPSSSSSWRLNIGEFPSLPERSDADHRSKLRMEERGSGVDIATKENRGGPLLAQDMEEEESGPRNDLLSSSSSWRLNIGEFPSLPERSDADHRSKLRMEERGSSVDIATKEKRGGPLLAQDMEEEESGPKNDLPSSSSSCRLNIGEFPSLPERSDADHRSKLRMEERGSGVDIATKENRGGPLLAQDMEEEESGPRNDLPSSSSSWRLNIGEFPSLPKRSNADHRSFTFRRLLCTPRKRRNVADYYKKQERLLEGFVEMEAITSTGFAPGSPTEYEDERNQLAKRVKLAVRISNMVNIVLFTAWIYASISSGSMAIIASTLDSVSDLLSSFILWYTAHAMRHPNRFRYPIGKKQMQPVGLTVYAAVMATLGLQILFLSGRQLMSKSQPDRDPEKEKWLIGIMVSVILVKFVLMVYCRRIKHKIVRAYAQNHFLAVITRSASLAAAVLAIKFYWWIDPAGAILVALFTTWTKADSENVRLVIGRAAPPEFLAKLTYLIWNHDEEIKYIETVRAYTFGADYFVEVDIVLPEDMLLNKAHDIGEELQKKLEQVPDVRRAFVHIDFEFTHRHEHKTISYS